MRIGLPMTSRIRFGWLGPWLAAAAGACSGNYQVTSIDAGANADAARNDASENDATTSDTGVAPKDDAGEGDGGDGASPQEDAAVEGGGADAASDAGVSDSAPTCTPFPADAGSFTCNSGSGEQTAPWPGYFCAVLVGAEQTPTTCQCMETYNCACVLGVEMHVCSPLLFVGCSDSTGMPVVTCQE
jgi:hypothetical protein